MYIDAGVGVRAEPEFRFCWVHQRTVGRPNQRFTLPHNVSSQPTLPVHTHRRRRRRRDHGYLLGCAYRPRVYRYIEATKGRAPKNAFRRMGYINNDYSPRMWIMATLYILKHNNFEPTILSGWRQSGIYPYERETLVNKTAMRGNSKQSNKDINKKPTRILPTRVSANIGKMIDDIMVGAQDASEGTDEERTHFIDRVYSHMTNEALTPQTKQGNKHRAVFLAGGVKNDTPDSKVHKVKINKNPKVIYDMTEWRALQQELATTPNKYGITKEREEFWKQKGVCQSCGIEGHANVGSKQCGGYLTKKAVDLNITVEAYVELMKAQEGTAKAKAMDKRNEFGISGYQIAEWKAEKLLDKNIVRCLTCGGDDHNSARSTKCQKHKNYNPNNISDGSQVVSLPPTTANEQCG
eukprot:m.157537 g.157537  ORF g.157537 m.157537 type:complete len:408 (+) comp31059_c0_seq7:1287-2510(+)